MTNETKIYLNQDSIFNETIYKFFSKILIDWLIAINWLSNRSTEWSIDFSTSNPEISIKLRQSVWVVRARVLLIFFLPVMPEKQLAVRCHVHFHLCSWKLLLDIIYNIKVCRGRAFNPKGLDILTARVFSRVTMCSIYFQKNNIVS